ncbi:MAG: magnesium transporter MgtE [Thermoplasmata archaeon HGW-Thermoplasmata-1]|nr:MAG: magnesium transporter MgtE [Thermoplasmata archaeon HGW-Thermoplasmata-1]
MPLQTTRKKVGDYCHSHYIALFEEFAVTDAVAAVRERFSNGRAVYFYTIDKDNKLTGVLQVRSLLGAKPSTKLSEISNKEVVSIKEGSSLLAAAELLHSRKLLSLPVIDGEGRMKGVIDVNQLLGEELSLSNRSAADEAFQMLGFRISSLKGASVFKNVRIRFPWMLSTIASGAICAAIANVFSSTLEKSIALAFFLTLILGLGESISVQSATIALQQLYADRRKKNDSRGWRMAKRVAREVAFGLCIGVACGLIVGAISLIMNLGIMITLVLFVSITLSMLDAAVIGALIPLALNRLKLNPKIASGPIVLAITDISTIVLYFVVSLLIL